MVRRIVMESIEERAIEFAKGRRYECTAYDGYIAGAIKQKIIDIENACKACENELRRLKTLLNERGVPSNLISVGKSLSRIRKEMEEEI